MKFYRNLSLVWPRSGSKKRNSSFRRLASLAFVLVIVAAINCLGRRRRHPSSSSSSFLKNYFGRRRYFRRRLSHFALVVFDTIMETMLPVIYLVMYSLLSG